MTTTRPLLQAAALAFLLTGTGTAARAAETPSLEALWELVQAQQAEIDRLTAELDQTRGQLATTEAQAQVTEERLSLTTEYLDDIAEGHSAAPPAGNRTTIGGYGELHYNHVEADDSAQDFDEIDFHRLVTFVGHEFTDRIRFFSEIEIEHALVHDTADGSGTGELEIEQAYIEFDLSESYFARAGLFLVPVGILNETHEPNTFYGVERNDVESVIIPSTWWEAGGSAGGRYGNGLSWDLALHSGLEMPTDGSSAFRVRSGRQKVSNANAEAPALTGRIRYTGLPGLELAATVHYEDDASQISGDGLEDGLLVSMHGIFNWERFQLRALWAQWDFDGDLIELAGADEQTGWYVEPSFRLGRTGNDWGLYARYEDVEGARAQDQFSQWEAGVNYWPTPNVVLKFGYRDRDHDLAAEGGRDFSAVDLGVGYQF